MQKYIAALGAAGMSDDESIDGAEEGVQALTYEATQLPWRAKWLTKVVRTMDLLHLSSHFTANGKVKKGAFPRLRVTGKKVDEEAVPPAGLPRNFYDEEWYNNQDEFTRLNLQAKEPVEIHMTDRLLK